MRRSSVVQEVKYFYELLDVKCGGDKTHAGNIYKIVENWKEISTALYKLNEYPFIGKSVEEIFNMGPSYQSSVATLSIISSEYKIFLHKLDIVKAKCEAILNEQEYINSEENVLYMKLPEDISDLKELSNMISNLDISFNKCPILRNEIGIVTFKRVEEGSSWLVLTVGTIVVGSKVLEWIANFICKCNEIRLQHNNIEISKLDIILKKMEIEEKEIERLRKTYESNVEEEIRKICLEKFKEIGIENIEMTPEDSTKIVHSMKTLIDILERGAEFYPSNEVSEETKKLFPKKERFIQIEDAKKLLDFDNVEDEGNK